MHTSVGARDKTLQFLAGYFFRFYIHTRLTSIDDFLCSEGTRNGGYRNETKSVHIWTRNKQVTRPCKAVVDRYDLAI